VTTSSEGRKVKLLRFWVVLLVVCSCQSLSDRSPPEGEQRAARSLPDQGEIGQTEQALDECRLPMDDPNVAECAFCSRAAYSEYRTFACQNQCWLEAENQTPTYFECGKQRELYYIKRAACKVAQGEVGSITECCLGYSFTDIPSAAWTYLSDGLGPLVSKIAGHKVQEQLNLTACPLGSALCAETACGKSTQWCVPADGDCAPQDPDMPFLCGRTLDKFGPCGDPNPCPAGQLKMFRRTPGQSVSHGGWLCVPGDRAKRCSEFDTPPQCPTDGGGCGPCDDRNCPPPARWDRVTNSCTACGAGMAVAVNDTTGATSCVSQAVCDSGGLPSDLYPSPPPPCPLSCPAPKVCTWTQYSHCQDPCFSCPYCN
jgi:hypothetical protein